MHVSVEGKFIHKIDEFSFLDSPEWESFSEEFPEHFQVCIPSQFTTKRDKNDNFLHDYVKALGCDFVKSLKILSCTWHVYKCCEESMTAIL